MKKIGLLGCGAIGTQIALAIDSGKIPGVLTHVYDSSKDASTILVQKLKNKPEIVENPHLLSSHPVDIIVEAASQDAVRNVAHSVLQNKRDLMIMSVGYAINVFTKFLIPQFYPAMFTQLAMTLGAVGGLPTMLWLMIKGARVQPVDRLAS